MTDDRHLDIVLAILGPAVPGMTGWHAIPRLCFGPSPRLGGGHSQVKCEALNANQAGLMESGGKRSWS